MDIEKTEEQKKHTDSQERSASYSANNDGFERVNNREGLYETGFDNEESAPNYRPRGFRNNNNRYDNRSDRGGYPRRNDNRGGGYYPQQDNNQREYQSNREYPRRGYDNRYPNEDFSYRDRFLATQKTEDQALDENRDDQQPQRRRRMRISEVKAMGNPQEERFGGYGQNPQQRFDNNNRYNRPYDNRRGMGGDHYQRQDRYRNNYGSYGNDRYSRMDEYDRRGGYNNYESGHDNSQREYYKERYNQARENNRQQFEYRMPYNNGDDRYQQGRNNNNRRPQQRRGYGNNEGYGNNQMRRGGGYNNDNKYPQKFQKKSKPGQKFTPRPTPIVYENDYFDENEPIRLNKYLANSGVCSRREADELIQNGTVLVNGEVVTELGTKITLKDSVVVDGKEVKPENKVYVLLNKPRNCVTTSDDPQERLTVLHLVKNACKERIYPVGRLDRNTTGVLLLTNDGDMASKLVHPSFKKKKIYHVWLDKEVTVEDMQKIADGIELEDGEMHADAISYASEDDHTQVGIEIHSGRNRIVRRIFEHLGYHVYKLDRVYFAGLTKKNLPRGKWRYLSQDEVNMLRMGAFE